ncbi:hypothetical protein ACFSM5_02510 [Lacibacterium aquatile]|uniref:Uncharacterized protein n=1 Tax=Lacibacterium aquatile TaxID=1168082 RepID=A0ABW5DKV3_9PROT
MAPLEIILGAQGIRQAEVKLRQIAPEAGDAGLGLIEQPEDFIGEGGEIGPAVGDSGGSDLGVYAQKAGGLQGGIDLIDASGKGACKSYQPLQIAPAAPDFASDPLDFIGRRSERRFRLFYRSIVKTVQKGKKSALCFLYMVERFIQVVPNNNKIGFNFT